MININHRVSQKHSTNDLLSSKTFLAKNKITVNEVNQAHFTVQGVQSYAPNQIQALLSKQKKFYQSKEGEFIKPSVYKISADLIKDQDLQALQVKVQRQKQKIKLQKQKAKGDTVKPRNKVQNNNQVISKLQSTRNKKTLLQKKLKKLSKHYKNHFQQGEVQKDTNHNQMNEVQDQQQKSNLCESIKNLTCYNNQQENSFHDQKQKDNIKDKKSVPSTNISTKVTKKTAKNDKNKQIDLSESKVSNCKDSNFEEVDWEEEGIKMMGQIICNKSTYSQKLGTALHSLFG